MVVPKVRNPANLKLYHLLNGFFASKKKTSTTFLHQATANFLGMLQHVTFCRDSVLLMEKGVKFNWRKAKYKQSAAL
jgi:hypothetical protein